MDSWLHLFQKKTSESRFFLDLRPETFSQAEAENPDSFTVCFCVDSVATASFGTHSHGGNVLGIDL